MAEGMERMMVRWVRVGRLERRVGSAVQAAVELVSEGEGLVEEREEEWKPWSGSEGLKLRYRREADGAEVAWNLEEQWGQVKVRLAARHDVDICEAPAVTFSADILSRLHPDEELPRRVWSQAAGLRGLLRQLLDEVSRAKPPILAALTVHEALFALAAFLPTRDLVALESASPLLRQAIEADDVLWKRRLRMDFPRDAARLLADASAKGLSPRTAYAAHAHKEREDRLKGSRYLVRGIGLAHNPAFPNPHDPLGPRNYNFHFDPLRDIRPFPRPNNPHQPLPRPVHPDIHPIQPIQPYQPYQPQQPGPFPNIFPNQPQVPQQPQAPNQPNPFQNPNPNPGDPFNLRPFGPQGPGHMGPEIYNPLGGLHPPGGPRFNPPGGGGGGMGGPGHFGGHGHFGRF